MKPLWFKAKKYGYGWYPVTWQGWSVLAVYVAFVFGSILFIDRNSHSASDTLRPFLILDALATVLLVWICVKTGEPARWRWGEDDDGTPPHR